MSELLTAREYKVLCYLSVGMTQEGIARHLGVSARSIRRNQEAILSKLNAVNCAHAVHLAHLRRWLAS